MKKQIEPVFLFLSYAHEDEKLCQELMKHLSLLQREGLISTWYSQQIMPGTNRIQEIDTHLETAAIILLLISPDFIYSDFCYSTEMKHALQREKDGYAHVIPVLLRPVDWKSAPFAHLQMLPIDAKPIVGRRDRDTIFADIAATIRQIIDHSQQLEASVHSIQSSGPNDGDKSVLRLYEQPQSKKIIFASIRIDKNNCAWHEVLDPISEAAVPFATTRTLAHALIPDPYHRLYGQHFHSAHHPTNQETCDPSFDITLLNTTSRPLILTAIGIELVNVAEVFPLPGGGPRAFKVPVSASYTIDLPEVWKQLDFWKKAQRIGNSVFHVPPIQLNEIITIPLSDPIYVQSRAPFRYTILLNHYLGYMPNSVILRFLIQTHENQEWSDYMYFTQGTVWWEEEDVQIISSGSYIKEGR